MKVVFQTKTESKKEQEQYFLALPPAERLKQFFALSRRMLQFPVSKDVKLPPNNNFVIDFTRGK